MVIVSDTSPLRYLIEIEAVEALPHLYGQVITTPAVIKELQVEQFPEAVVRWANAAPFWLSVQSPLKMRFEDILDAGEASAVSLAMERGAKVLLVDERRAASVARSLGIIAVGTLAVLRDAGLAGTIDFHQKLKRLTSRTKFHHTQALVDRVIADFDSQRLHGD